jgi:hypothetical protein
MDKTFRPCVYIAGALRGTIPEYIANVSRMIKTGEEVRRNGFSVFIPGLDFLNGVVMGDLDFHDYFLNSWSWIPKCDAVFVTPQSENSQGTKEEIELALSLGIPIFDNISDLVFAFQPINSSPIKK